MNKQQYSHIKKTVGEYTISYGVIQALNDSCDTIDFFKINETIYGFYLADVAGPGKASITIMNKLQELINKNCLECLQNNQEYTFNPSLIAKAINSEIYNRNVNKYITLIYGILNLSNNIIEYTTAGYYPNPIWVTEQNTHKHAKYIFSKGYPLGILPNAEFDNFQIKMEKNNAVIFFSDGIMNFFKPDIDNTKNKDDELLKLIINADINISNILEELNLNYSAPTMDDIVVLTLQRN